MSSIRLAGLLLLAGTPLFLAGPARATGPAGDPVHLGPLEGDGAGILAHRADPDLLLAIHHYPPTMLRSTDGGASFTESNVGLPTGSFFSTLYRVLRQDPKDADTVYMLADFRVHRSTDFGLSWTALTLQDFGLEQLLVSSADDTILARTDEELYRSTDAGDTWQVVATGTNLNAAAISESDPSRVYYGESGGVFRSDDGGATFAPTPFTKPTRALGVSPADPDLVLAAVYESSTTFLWRSTDGLASSQFVTSLGVFAQPELIAWNPFATNEIWITNSFDVLRRSLDGGLTFATTTLGSGGTPSITQFSVQLDGSVLLTANNGLWRLPVSTSTWERIGFALVAVRDVAVLGAGPVTLTSDGTFILNPDQQVGVSTNFTGAFVGTSCIAVDPEDPEHWFIGGALADFYEDSAIVELTGDGTDKQLAYVGYIDGPVDDVEFVPGAPGVVVAGKGSTFPNAITRSTDNGDTWQNVLGPSGWDVRDLAVDPHAPGRIVALLRDADVAESLDAGATWTAPAVWIPGVDDGVQLAFDPHRSGTAFLLSSSSGLWRTLNGGNSWQNLGVGLLTSSELVFSAEIPGLLWITDDAGAVQVSADRGNSFQVVWQPPTGTVAGALALDAPNNALLVGTSNHGLFELPDISPYEVLGGGTPGTDGIVPRTLPLLALPEVGGLGWGLRGTGGVGGGLAVFVLGLTEFELPIYGGAWHVFPPTLYTLALPLSGTPGVGGGGNFTLPIPIPADPSLSAVRLVAQFLVVGDPNSTDPSGYVLSDALETVILP